MQQTAKRRTSRLTLFLIGATAGAAIGFFGSRQLESGYDALALIAGLALGLGILAAAKCEKVFAWLMALLGTLFL